MEYRTAAAGELPVIVKLLADAHRLYERLDFVASHVGMKLDLQAAARKPPSPR